MQRSTSNCASSSFAWDAAGLANNSPDGGTISWKLGVPVSPRAPVSLAQPEGAPRLVTSLRYPAVPVCTTLAIDRMGEMLFSVASMTARSEEHTSELQSLMRISYAVFCLKKKKQPN